MFRVRVQKSLNPFSCLTILQTTYISQIVGSNMPYIYEDGESLEDMPLIGSKQCVALIQYYTSAPAAVQWKEGQTVKGNAEIKKRNCDSDIC